MVLLSSKIWSLCNVLLNDTDGDLLTSCTDTLILSNIRDINPAKLQTRKFHYNIIKSVEIVLTFQIYVIGFLVTAEVYSTPMWQHQKSSTQPKRSVQLTEIVCDCSINLECHCHLTGSNVVGGLVLINVLLSPSHPWHRFADVLVLCADSDYFLYCTFLFRSLVRR